MSKSNWAVIWALVIICVGAAVLADKGTWLNAVVTGQCNACPAPPQCKGSGGLRQPPVSIDGCDPPWWKRHG